MLVSWLPEPAIEDESVKNHESYMDWLRRNTSNRAKKSRAFLNYHIEELPREWIDPINPKEGLKHDLEHRWASAFFELVCARVLQKLGASIEVEIEKKTKDGTTKRSKPDFTATFPDYQVIVEAASTILDPNSRNTSKDQCDLIEILKAQIPTSWSFFAWSLPQIGQRDSKSEFKKAVAGIVTELPESADNTIFYVEKVICSGTIYLEMIPKVTDASWLAGPPNDSVDNIQKNIEKAVHRKRKQVRQSGTPVVLAINMDGLGASYEDFEQVLFGRSWLNVKDRTTGFEANGLFTGRVDKEKPPTFAGVLAFFNVGLWGWNADPILYINPRFRGEIPNGLLRLERRLYDSERNTIIGVKTQYPDLRKEMLFANGG
jgi:hypothetical protein